MRLLCLYASLLLSVGPIYFCAEPYLICQAIQWPYREGSWLPSTVFPPTRTLLPLPGKGLCCWIIPLIKYNGLALKHLRFTSSPLQPGYLPAGWLSWCLESRTHRDWTKLFGFLSLAVLAVIARQQRSSLLRCACVQGNCKVKKEQGLSRGTSGTFIFNLSWKHGGFADLIGNPLNWSQRVQKEKESLWNIY